MSEENLKGGYRPMGPDREKDAKPTPVLAGHDVAITRPASFEVPAGTLGDAESLVEQIAEPGKIEVLDEVRISALEAGLEREIRESREVPREPVVTGFVGFPGGGCCDYCDECSDDEAEEKRQARIFAAAEFLEALAEAPNGVTPVVKDRARAAAAALRWALDESEPSPSSTLFGS